MQIGVTGGTGFIGKEVVHRHLQLGDGVRILSRRSRDTLSGLSGAVEVVQADLADRSGRLTRFTKNLDVLYHCAGELTDEARMHALHVDGTRALLAAASGTVGRWVQLSSVGVYGRHRVGLVTEDDLPNPVGAYESTKSASDDLVQTAGKRGDLQVTTLRPSIVFGARMPNRAISQMARMIELGLFFFIGRPGASANYIAVSNVVDALVLCATRSVAAGRVYNLSDWCTMEDFVEAICGAVGATKPRVRVPERPIRLLTQVLASFPLVPLTPSRIDALVNRTRYSITRIQAELGYSHALSIAEGLRHLLAARNAS